MLELSILGLIQLRGEDVSSKILIALVAVTVITLALYLWRRRT